MDKEMKEAVRIKMVEWIENNGGQPSKKERVMKWRELAKQYIRHKAMLERRTVTAKANKARRQELAEKFKQYRPNGEQNDV